MNQLKACLLFLLILIFFSSCEENYVPKPIGYMRIGMVEQKYESYKIDDLFSFEVSDQAKVETLSQSKETVKFNIAYPQHKAKIHMAYNHINNNLRTYLEETRKLTYQHHQKANDIDKVKVSDESRNVYGINYTLTGDVASASQFFVTDSANHFLRGALYFWSKPNADSLAPVLEYIKHDIDRIVETINWESSK